MSFLCQTLKCQPNGASSPVHCVQKTIYTIKLDFEIFFKIAAMLEKNFKP